MKRGVFVHFILLGLLFILFVSCGGPKKYNFEVSTKIERPESLSQENFQRIQPIIRKVVISSLLKVIDKRGVAITQYSNTSFLDSELKASSTFKLDVEDESYTVEITVWSSRFLSFSNQVVKKKFEQLKKEPICKEGDKDRDGFDFMCSFQISVKPAVSDTLLSYVKIREDLSGAKEQDFCNVYVSVQPKVNGLDQEIKELALQDVKDIYDSFVSKMRTEVDGISSKVIGRDCSGKKRLEEIKKYFCLPERILTKVQDLDNFCVALSLYEEGLALMRKGNNTQALDKFRASVRIKANFSDPYVAMGDIYRQEKRYEDAVYMYQRAVDYSPSDATSYVKLADTYMAMMKFQDAERTLRTAIDILGERGGHDLYFKRALALFELQRYDEASEPAKKSIELILQKPEIKYDTELRKTLAEYKILLGRIYAETQRKEEAIRELKEALEINPFSDSALLYLARVFSESDDKSKLKEAKGFYDKLFSLDSRFARDGKVRYDYVLLLEKIGSEEQDLISALENVLKYDKTNPEAYMKLARLYSKKPGYQDLAETNYKRAFELSQNNPDYLAEYVDFLIKRGKYDVAKKTIENYFQATGKKDDKVLKQKYNEVSLLLYKVNPQLLRKLGLTPQDLELIYSTFASLPSDLSNQISETLSISSEVFEKLDPYKKFIAIIFYMDLLYGKEKGSVLQKEIRYNELFGKNVNPKLITKISKLTSDSVGLNLMR
jgi:tetratricopeptide (TPR) repeat protein